MITTLLLCATLTQPQPQVHSPEAALPRPTPAQAAWADAEVGMFIHFAPNTWQDREYDDLSTKNPAWKKIYEDYANFHRDANLWFRFTEARFDSFMQGVKL